MLVDCHGVADQDEIDVGDLVDVMVQIAFEEDLAFSFGDGVGSSFQICFPCAVRKAKANEPCNIGLCDF